jgi:hypothetical protein
MVVSKQLTLQSITEGLTAERRHLAVILLEDTDSIHGVLVGGLEFGVRLRLTLEIHLAEHVQGRFLASTASAITILVLERSGQLPTAFVTAEAEWFAVLSSGLVYV